MAIAGEAAAAARGFPGDAGGRARRGPQHAAGLPARPRGLPRASSSAGADRLRARGAGEIGAYLRAMSEAGTGAGLARAAAVRDPPAVQVPRRRRRGRGGSRRSGFAGPKQGRPLPKTLSVAEVDRLIEAARGRTDDTQRPRARAGAAAACADRDALRHRPARDRAGDAAALGARGRRPRADHQGQGRARAHRAAQRRPRAPRSTAISTSAARTATTWRR